MKRVQIGSLTWVPRPRHDRGGGVGPRGPEGGKRGGGVWAGWSKRTKKRAKAESWS